MKLCERGGKYNMEEKDKNLLKECAKMLDGYYDIVKPKKNYDDCVRLNQEDMNKWQTIYFPKLVQSGWIPDYQYFGSTENLGIGNDGYFNKTEYCHFMYQAYKVLAGDIAENQMISYIKKCIQMFEKYVGEKCDRSKTNYLAGAELDIWKKDYYLYLSQSGIIADSSFFSGEPNMGIGNDGIFGCTELLHFLYQCYQYICQMKELPKWKVLLLYCPNVTNGKIESHGLPEDESYIKSTIDRYSKFMFVFSGGNVIFDIEYHKVDRLVKLSQSGDKFNLYCQNVKQEIDTYAPPKTKDLIITYTRYGDIPTSAYAFTTGISAASNYAGYITVGFLKNMPPDRYLIPSLENPPKYVPFPEEVYVHETIHVLDGFYSSKYHKVPNSDQASKYNYPCQNPGGIHGFYKFYQDALINKVLDPDTKEYIGVRPDMWCHSPSKD